MAEFKVKVTTEADTKGAQETQKHLRDIYREAGGGLKGLSAIGNQLRDIYKQAGGGASGLFAVIAAGSAGAVAAVGLLTGALLAAKKALLEFGQAEESVLKLQAALASKGNLTAQVNADYQELASTLQKLTGKADDEWIDVLTRLTQFGSTPDQIARDADAVKNLAGIMGGDLQGAAQLVSRALEGNFQMFGRLGIEIDENGTKIEKLDSLYRQLAERGGGQLEASAQSLNGTFRTLRNSVGDLWEALGQRVASLGVLQSAVSSLAWWADFLAQKIGGIVPVSERMQNALKANTAATIDAERFNRQHADSLGDLTNWNEKLNAALEQQLETELALIRAKDEKADAEMAYKLALINRAEKLPVGKGGITPEEAAKQRLVVRTESEARKFQTAQQIRATQAVALQRSLEAKMQAVEEAEEEAQKAEKEVESREAEQAARAGVINKLRKEAEHWKRNLEMQRTSPLAYSNAELGIQQGDKSLAEFARIDQMLVSKRDAAQKALEDKQREFNESAGVISGGSERARTARENANKVRGKNSSEIDSIVGRINALADEKTRAAEAYRIRSRATVLDAGTEFQGQFPNAKIFGRSGRDNLRNTRGIEAEVMRATQAFNGQMTDMGALVSKNFETMGAAVLDVTRRLQQLEKQQARGRKW